MLADHLAAGERKRQEWLKSGQGVAEEVATTTFEQSVPGAIERREEVLKKIADIFTQPSNRLNKGIYMDQSKLIAPLTAFEEKQAAIDAYKRHKNLTTRTVQIPDPLLPFGSR